MSKFADFFRTATGGHGPYPFQGQFATSTELPHLVRAPTGAGKTATAILGWLWRWQSKVPNTPRRLVYCLPMRVLVEQSAAAATGWISNLKLDIPVHVLMGGVDTEQWYLHPEQPAVLIGTQDMLLSRALNRGYAASRFHWPIDFGLLNNDCLWVFDEPQLMASGVSTSAQLEGLRNILGTTGPCASVWMSATLEPGWLDTVDFAGRFPAAPLELTDEDYDPDRPLYKRMTAVKKLAPLGVAASKDMKEVARAVIGKHQAGTQTLVVLNTVDRAKAVYAAIQKDKSAPKNILLVHSRFRSAERERLNAALQEKGDATTDRIIVATQVVEAGVDISARTLITELAPWASIVQRIGRCNRTGDDGPGQVFWIDVPSEEKDARPYTPDDLTFAREQMEKLQGKDVSPRALDKFKTREKIVLPVEHKHVLRRRDLLDLFDTTPDLSGNDIDISRFVRSDDPETDVQVFWRTIPEDGPTENEPSPLRKELCRVPVGQLRDFLTDGREGFVWDHLEREWVRLELRQLRPGLTVLLPAVQGGYDPELGWTGEPKPPVTPVAPAGDATEREDATDSDTNSETPNPRTISQHTNAVYKAVEAIVGALTALLADTRQSLLVAARWHDAGKAHLVFRSEMDRLNGKHPDGDFWAKSGGNGRLNYCRKRFRHELASALAALQHGKSFEVAYLIAAHHGKVRVSLRALPGEEPPEPPDLLFALGICDGDELPTVELGGEQCPAVKLDLSLMRLGTGSWSGRALQLRDTLGPFRLAYLEAVLRAADQRVSNAERKGEKP